MRIEQSHFWDAHQYIYIFFINIFDKFSTLAQMISKSCLYFVFVSIQFTVKHRTVCLSPKQLSTRRLLWKALPLGSRPGPEQMFAQTTQYNILYNIQDVFGTMQKYISLITNRNVHCFPIPRNCCTLFCSRSARKSRGCC